MFVNSRHNGVLSPAFSQVSAFPSPSAFPLLKVPNTLMKPSEGSTLGSKTTYKKTPILAEAIFNPYPCLITAFGHTFGHTYADGN